MSAHSAADTGVKSDLSETRASGGDLLMLPAGTCFGVGNYTLQIEGAAVGGGMFGLPAGSCIIGAATLALPEPETPGPCRSPHPAWWRYEHARQARPSPPEQISLPA